MATTSSRMKRTLISWARRRPPPPNMERSVTYAQAFSVLAIACDFIFACLRFDAGPYSAGLAMICFGKGEMTFVLILTARTFAAAHETRMARTLLPA